MLEDPNKINVKIERVVVEAPKGIHLLQVLSMVEDKGYDSPEGVEIRTKYYDQCEETARQKMETPGLSAEEVNVISYEARLQINKMYYTLIKYVNRSAFSFNLSEDYENCMDADGCTEVASKLLELMRSVAYYYHRQDVGSEETIDLDSSI